ncbi:MAG: hypothetical protein WA364_24120 [Candidatus Nitrosopolaris sp.]
MIRDNCWGDPWIPTVTFHLGTSPTNPSKFVVYLNENAGLPLVAEPLVAPPTKQAPETVQFIVLELVAEPLEAELLEAETADPFPPNAVLTINCPVACCSGLYIKSKSIIRIEIEK